MFCVQDKVRADVAKFAAEVNALETDAEASGALSEAQTATGVNGGRPSLFDGYDVALVEADAEVAAAGECICIFVRAITLTPCLCTDALLAEVQNMSKVFGNFVRAAATQVSLFAFICIIIVRASI